MNRLNHTRLRRRLSPRITVISGAALGLILGATVYSAVSSSAEATKPVAFMAAKAPVTPAPAPARFSACAAGSKLEKDVCVVRVVRTVVAAPASGAAAPASSTPSSATKPAEVAKPGSAATPRSAAGSDTPAAASGTPSSGGGDDGEGAQTAAHLSPQAAAELAAKNAAALAAKDAATLGANDPVTLAANKAATKAAGNAASFSTVRGD